MSKKEENKKTREPSDNTEEAKELVPPLDFSSLVLPFYMQCLIKLGMAKDPSVNKFEKENLELAKRLIELLNLLKERTEGNLKPEEQKFLDICLQQLKLGYTDKAKVFKL